jgi:uncharacterized protein
MNWQKQQYLSLASRKRDGSFVETPVWFANQGNTFYIFSEGKAWKVKRVRNFSEVFISPCTVTGKITGEKVAGQAEILTDDKAVKIAHQTLLKKYGWKMRLLDLGSALAGKKNKRAFIKIEIE